MSEVRDFAWIDELRALLAGKRDAHVRSLGSAEEYVERLLADSRDHRMAEQTFIDALDAEVTAWQPDRHAPAYYKRTLLELINAYTPPHGFGKLFEQAELWLSDDWPTETAPDAIDLRELTLSAIARYFPVPPADPGTNAGFKEYLGLLFRLIRFPQLTPTVTALLLRAGVMPLSSAPVADAILGSDDVLRGVLAQLQPRLRNRATDEVAAVLRLCIRSGETSLDRFISAAESLGLPVYLDYDAILVITAGGIEVRIAIDQDQISEYTVLRWAIDSRRALERLTEFDNDRATGDR